MIDSISTMHDRSNGLGGGFAGYGIYPTYKQYYALHVFYDGPDAKSACEALLEKHFDIIFYSEIPTRNNPNIGDAPLIWRYFVRPRQFVLEQRHLDEAEFVVKLVQKVHTEIPGAFIFSSGKNMGTFKAVGYPEDVGDFYRLDEYEGYCWTAHGRYPTNTPGWWGGAHPFTLLDFSVVHNGEISSYDANRRFIEMFGYKCTLQTDTEVITYLLDYLLRTQGLTLAEAAHVIAAPFWSTIEAMEEKEADWHKYLRQTFPDMLINGPFSILFGYTGGIMALNDRLKLRSMVVAEKRDKVYFASEECAIRAIEPNLDCIWAPRGGEAVIVELNEEGRKCL